MAFSNTHKYARISPRKVRLVVDTIRGKSFEEAWTLLCFSKRRAAVMVRRCLEAAASNAEDPNQGGLDRRKLVVVEARVDAGPTLKRWQPKDRGRAFPIMKRTSHIHVSVEEK